jgi:hypothetical protein
MRLFRAVALALALVCGATPALAQCRVDAARRDEALVAVRLIARALMRVGATRMAPYPRWEELAGSSAVAALRGMGGPAGEVARKIRWGAAEPLPGWQIHFVTSGDSYALSLTDTLESCGFSYYSNDTGVISEGQPITGRGPGIVPIT